MEIAQFKKIARLLKTVYKEIETQALSEGVDILSSEYEQLLNNAREAILRKQGFTVQEYLVVKNELEQERKAKQELNTQAAVVVMNEAKSHLEQTSQNLQQTSDKLSSLEGLHIPSTEEIVSIAHGVAKQYIVPPVITNQIVKEITIPTIVKETKIETINVVYNEKPLQEKLGALSKRVDEFKIPPPFDDTKLREDIKNDFGDNFERNINMYGMPNFRKLALGLRQDIDALIARPVSTIGGTITGGTTGSVLFVGPSSTFAQDNVNLNFSDSTDTLTVPNIDGSVSANGDLTLQGTSNATRTTSYVNLQPNGGNVGIGTASPGAKLHVLGTTEQQRIGYDTSNYYSTTVGSTGLTTFNAVGSGSAFTFSDNVTIASPAGVDTGSMFNVTAGLYSRTAISVSNAAVVTMPNGLYMASAGIALDTAGGATISGSSNNISLNSNGTTGYTSTTGKLGVGHAPTAYLDVLATTEQLRVGYDTSNYYKTTVGSTGATVFDAVGSGASFSFADQLIGKGTATNDDAASTYIGEYISASVVQGSATPLTTATPKTVTSISLTAGDWDVTGIGALTGASTGTVFDVAIGTTTNSFTGTVLGDTRMETPTVSLTGADASLMVPAVRVSISGTTTYYLIVAETFTIGTPAAYGRISARRVR